MPTFRHNVPSSDLLARLLRTSPNTAAGSIGWNILNGQQCQGRAPKEPSLPQLALARIALDQTKTT